MINVIIPAYNAEKTIERTINSILYQTILDKIIVTIVNDCGKNDYHDLIDKYSRYMKIEEIDLDKNMGPGIAREVGIDKTNSEYICFIDSDDAFYSPDSIEKLFNNIQDSDIVIGNFIEVDQNNNYIFHENDNVWLHGKMYRRSFILNNDIHFNESRANEDTGFNQKFLLCNPRIKNISDNVYMWLFNENSITRNNNGEYGYKGLKGFVDNMIDAIKFGESHNLDVKNLSIVTMLDMYFYYIIFDNEELLKISKDVLEYFDKYKDDNIISELYDIQKGFIIKDDNKIKLINSNINFPLFCKMVGEYSD